MTNPTPNPASLSPATPRVLLADDQPSIVEALVFLLKIRGIHSDIASSPAEVIERVNARRYDLLLMDMNYEQDTTSGAEGLRLVDAVRVIDPALGVVVMTAWSTVEIAVAALQRGASDFIQKPWDNDTAAKVIMDQIAATSRRRHESALSQAEQEQARQVQRSLMGEAAAVVGPFTVSAESRSSRMVGGDFFDVKKLSDGRLLICVADVMGKGMGAALMMSNFQAHFRTAAAKSADPAGIASELNAWLHTHVSNHLITAFIAVFDSQTRSVSFSSAGHPPALLYRTADKVQSLTSDDAVLGGVDNWTYRSASISLEKGDRIVVVSDGCLEASDPDGQEIGAELLADWLQESSAQKADSIKDFLMARTLRFCGDQLSDDATVIVIAVEECPQTDS